MTGIAPVYVWRMHFAKQDCDNALLVRSYRTGQVIVGTQHYQRSIILTPERVLDDWRPQQYQELADEDLHPLRDLQPEIVLLGTGPTLHFPHPSLTALLLEAGIGVEVMNTAAACRTFNILLSEDRNVVAALLLN